MKHITHIECRRWFQRTYGNTYNTVYIHFNDGDSIKLDKEYGYGDYCLQRAEEYIKQHLFTQDNPENLMGTRWIREVLNASYSIHDVQREKDL